MSKKYESEHTVVYENEDGDMWIKDKESGEREYYPHNSDKSYTFDDTELIDKDEDED